MKPVTLDELRSTLNARCGSDVEAALLATGPSQLHSPDVLDLVLWNVVIAFVVSFASNVAAMTLPRKSTLTFGDLQAIRKVAGARAEVTGTPSREAVSQTIRLALPTSMAEPDKTALSEKLASAVLDKLDHL